MKGSTIRTHIGALPTRPRGFALGRPRIALMVVLLAAAMPTRFSGSFPLVHSVSILDGLLVVAAVTLFLDLAFRPLNAAYPKLFAILSVPLIVSTVSLAWSQDRSSTLRAMFVYAEGLIAYLFVLRELEGLPATQVITYIKRYAYLLIIPGVLLLLHVPGFAPQLPGVKHSSGDYLSFYTRLSHPVIGRSNNLATVLAFFAPILLFWGHTRNDRRASRAGLITLVAIFATLSRGVILSFIVAAALYAPFAPRPRKRRSGGLGPRIALIVALGAVMIGLLYSVNPATHEYFGERFGLVNVNERSQLASEALTRIASRPLLGYGADASPTVPLTPDRPAKLDSHNAYLQQVLYFGLPLGVLVGLALLSTVGIFHARRRASALAGVLAYTLLVQLVSFLFESSFEGTLLRVIFYLSIGLAAALLRAVEAEEPVSAG